MRKLTPLQMTLLGAVVPLLVAAPAAAQATRTWVSGVGDDVNPCSRTAPCKTFPGAISKTAAGGAINVLDPGGYGAVVITKSMTIAQEGTGEAGILVAGTNGITVNAGPNDVVILRGLDIDGGPINSNSLAGVKFIAGGALIIQNCTIRKFTGGPPNGYGIAFTPSGTASLFVSDTVISNNGSSTGGGGVLIQPSGSASATATFVRVNAVGNYLGIRSDGTGSTGGISVSISDTTSASNTFGGMTAFSPIGGAAVKVTVSNSVLAHNATGLNANGAGATIRVGSSVVTSNATGVNIANGATVTSLGNNMIVDNLIQGPTLQVIGPQ